MKKFTLSVVIFFWGFSLFALPSLQEKKSLQLIQKLYEDKLYRLALLEIDWLSTHYPNSSLLAKSLFFQGLTFSKIQENQKSQKSLSKNPFYLFSSKEQKQIFFTQAINYFFLYELNLSNSFFKLVKTSKFKSSKESESIKKSESAEKSDMEIQATYYQILIAVFQGDIDRAKQILKQTSFKIFNKNQKNFLLLLQKKKITLKEFIKILDKNSLQNIQKLALVRFLAEQDFENKNHQTALERYFFFTLLSKNFEEKPLLVYLDFFIGEALYKNSLFAATYQSDLLEEQLVQEAKIYFTKNNHNIIHSRLYLANIYAYQKQYSKSFDEYNLLLKDSAYFKNKDLIFNYIQLSQLLKKDKTESIFIQAIESKNSLKDKQELSLQVIEFYQKQKNCSLIVKLFIENEFSPLKLDETLQAKENFSTGKCYLERKQFQKSFSYFIKIPFHLTEIILPTSALVSQALGNLKKEKENLKFFQKLQSFAKDTDFGKTEQKQIKQNSLLYYYYAKEWKKFVQKQIKYFSTKESTPKDWRNWELLAISQTELEQNPQALKSYQNAFSLVRDTAHKIRLAQKIILIHKSKKEHSKIANIYEQLLETIPQENQLAIKLTIAKNYFQDKRIYQAKKWLLEIVKKPEIIKKPQQKLTSKEKNFYFEANYFLAEIWIAQNQAAKAISILTDTAKLTTIDNKWYRLMHYRLGKIYRYQKNWQLALKHYQFVANTKKNSPEKKDAIIRVKAIKKLLASAKK